MNRMKNFNYQLFYVLKNGGYNKMRLLVILSPSNKWRTKTEYTNLKKILIRVEYMRIAPEVFM